jgi:hypothetical protein
VRPGRWHRLSIFVALEGYIDTRWFLKYGTVEAKKEERPEEYDRS